MKLKIKLNAGKLFICLPLIALLFTQSYAQNASRENFHLYLLIGQSNMAGRGEVEPIDQQAHPRVLTLSKDYQWEKAREPIQFDKPGIVGVGPGLAFGKALAEKNSDVSIGLIPAAVGGSSIRVWQKGKKHDQTLIYPFDEAVNRAILAAREGTLKGIIWHQGEGDSRPGLAGIYEESLIDFVHNIRKALGHPELPFVAGQLPSFFVESHPAAKEVNRAIIQAKGKLNNYSFVNAGNLEHIGDGTHLDAQSARKMGERYAREMEILIENQ